MYQLINEYADPVNECGSKNAPGCFVPVGININRKKNRICKKGNAAYSS